MSSQAKPVQVFISYSHDSVSHTQWVRELAERLRANGFETHLDQDIVGTPEQGWASWIRDRIDVADFVLLVCTQIYRERFLGHASGDQGGGAAWEGAIITEALYRKRGRTAKFVPILCSPEGVQFVPAPISAHTHYQPRILGGRIGYAGLVQFLRGQKWSAPRVEGLAESGAAMAGSSAGEGRSDFEQPVPTFLPYPSLGTLFVGREAELGKIDLLLANPGTPRIVISGLGGIGKSRLAVEFAWRRRSRYSAVLFARADSRETFEVSLATIARSGGLPGLSPEVLDARNPEPALRWLNQNPGWILVLDNVDTESMAEAVEDQLHRLSGGHVILTSRLTNWSTCVSVLEIAELNEEASAEFLLARTQPSRRRTGSDHQEAQRLAKALGGLALALEQCAAYIARKRISFGDYRELWEAQEQAVLNWFDERLMLYPRSVAITWNTSLEQLTPAGIQMLRLLSWLGAEPIPREFLLRERVVRMMPGWRPPWQDDSVVDSASDEPASAGTSKVEPADGTAGAPLPSPAEALSDLAGYSLIRLESEGNEVRVHQLVQTMTRARFDPFQRDLWILNVTGYAKGLLTELLEEPKNLGTLRPAAGHALAILDKVEPEKAGEHLEVFNSETFGTTAPNRWFCQHHVEAVARLAAQVFLSTGEHALQIRCWQHAIASRRQLPESSWAPDLAYYYRNLAHCYAMANDPQGAALALDAVALVRNTTALEGKEKAGWLAGTLQDAAQTLLLLGREDEALPLIEESISLRADQSVWKASGLSTQARILEARGAASTDPEKRRELLNQAWGAFNRSLKIFAGLDASAENEFALTRVRAAEFLLKCGETTKALGLLRPAVDSFEKLLPAGHHNLRSALMTLVQAEAKAGNDCTQRLQSALRSVEKTNAVQAESIEIIRQIHNGLAWPLWALGKVKDGAEAEREAWHRLLRNPGDFVKTDLAGVYLTLKTTYHAEFTVDELAQFRRDAEKYLTSRGYSWKDFQQQIHAILPTYTEDGAHI